MLCDMSACHTCIHACFMHGCNNLLISSPLGLLRLLIRALMCMHRITQATLLPILVDSERVGPDGTRLLKAMINMESAPPTQEGGAAWQVSHTLLIYAYMPVYIGVCLRLCCRRFAA